MPKSPMHVAEAGAIAVLVVMAAPLIALLVLAFAGTSDGGVQHLLSTVLPRYALTSAAVVVQVLGIAVVVGVGCAWLVAAYDFPARHWLQGALMLPLALPGFVVAYAYTDMLDGSGAVQGALRAVFGVSLEGARLPDLRSASGAAAVLGLGLYPYVYMFARTAFAERSAARIEAARTLGDSPCRAWLRVVWPAARPAIVAASALVAMETLADFGTVSYLAVDTFSAGIYRAWQGLGDRVAAARLSLALLAVIVALVVLERRQRSRLRYHGRGSRPPLRRSLRGMRALGAVLACVLPTMLGFLVPVLLLAAASWSSGGWASPKLPTWVVNSVLLAALGTLLTVPTALLGAYLGRLCARPHVRVALVLACSGYALPGVVLGIGLLSWLAQVDRMIDGLVLVGSIAGVAYAYLVRFFSVAFQGLESGLARISPSIDESARSLGRSPVGVLREIHWPLLRPSLVSAGLLVFVDCLKELPATLVLRPFDFDTLAVAAYHFAADERLGEAAAPALLIALVGCLPLFVLMRSRDSAASDAILSASPGA